MPLKFRISIRNHSFSDIFGFTFIFQSHLFLPWPSAPWGLKWRILKLHNLYDQAPPNPEAWRQKKLGSRMRGTIKIAPFFSVQITTFSCYRMTVMHLFVWCLRGTFMANPVHSALLGLAIYPPWNESSEFTTWTWTLGRLIILAFWRISIFRGFLVSFQGGVLLLGRMSFFFLKILKFRRL